jgi:sarcosine oxidase
MCYYLHEDYIPLLRRTYELWHQLESDTGRKLLYTTGLLFMGPRGNRIVQATADLADRMNVDYERLDGQEVRSRYPQFQVEPDFEALLDPVGGFVLPELAIASHVELALRAGAEIHGREPVKGFRETNGSITVETELGSYEADRLILCGGAWSRALLADLNVPLKVTRQVLGWVWPRKPEMFQLGRLPVWGYDAGPRQFYYGFPMMHDSPGFKFALDELGQETEADQIVRDPQKAEIDELRPCLERYLPDANPIGGGFLGLRVCMYTNTPDRHFIIDRHPNNERILVAAGFSGHGFKFSPVVGEILSDLATNGRTELPIGIFGLNRFA